MRLEVEGHPPVEGVGEARLRTAVAKLRSYGPASFAALTDADGNYLQVAGGGVTCMIERRDAATRQHYRAFQDKTSAVFPDGAQLVFGGGKITMQSDEWFTSKDVEEVFLRFLHEEPLPERIRWRDISGSLVQV